MVYACRHEGSDQVILRESVAPLGNDQVTSMVSFCLEDSVQVTSMVSFCLGDSVQVTSMVYVYLEGSVRVTVMDCVSLDTPNRRGSCLESRHQVMMVGKCRRKMEDGFVGTPLVQPWQALGYSLLHHDYTAFCYVL